MPFSWRAGGLCGPGDPACVVATVFVCMCVCVCVCVLLQGPAVELWDDERPCKGPAGQAVASTPCGVVCMSPGELAPLVITCRQGCQPGLWHLLRRSQHPSCSLPGPGADG